MQTERSSGEKYSCYVHEGIFFFTTCKDIQEDGQTKCIGRKNNSDQ